MNEYRKTHVVMLRAAAVLLILVMLSTSMVAGRYARYVTTAADSDSASVAKFSVTENGAFREIIKVKLAPGEKEDLVIEVKNDSEVAVEYSVSAENYYQNLPLEFTLLDGDTPLTTAILLPGETKELTLRICWKADKTDDQYIGMVDLIHLTVHVTQID